MAIYTYIYSLDYPTKRVMRDVTLGVYEGDRIGIVGRNGDGKSTLLSLLAGSIEPDDGRVTHRRGIAVGLLGQRDALADDDTVAPCGRRRHSRIRVGVIRAHSRDLKRAHR